MSGSIPEARKRIAAAMAIAGFPTAKAAMESGEIYIDNLKLCESQWSEYIASGCDKFYNKVDKYWYSAKKVLSPKTI